MFQLQWIWHNLKGYRKFYVTALVLSIVCNALYLTTPYFSKELVDKFLSSKDALFNLEHERKLFWLLLAGMVGFTLVRTICQYTCNMTYELSSQGMIYRIRTHLFRRIENQDMEFYDRNRTGDLMTRLTGDLDMVRHAVAFVFKGMLESCSLFIASSVYFFMVSWKMALLLLAVTPFIFGVVVLLDKKAKPVYVDLREKLSQMNTDAQENISGNRVVKAFAREDYEIEKFQKANKEYSDANKKASLLWLKFFPYMEAFANALSVVMLLGGGFFLIKGEITMGEYVAISGLIWGIANPVRNLGIYVNDMQRFMASAMKVIEIYYARPIITDREDAVDQTERLHGDVEFKDVTFKFGKHIVLDNVNFKIKAGQTVAIMGETGSGKTSLINLIPRFYDTNSGEVLVDGVNVRKRKLSQLRSQIGMATQDVLLFSDTIDGNIAYGDSDMSEEDVKHYAKLAAANEFVEKMPDGYETIVGERGVGLSGGQKQRLLITRALAKHPQILVLDDSSSALDYATDARLRRAIQENYGDLTSIIVAQRISSIYRADKIIVLEDGEMIGYGTHKNLMESCEVYREISQSQMGGGIDEA